MANIISALGKSFRESMEHGKSLTDEGGLICRPEILLGSQGSEVRMKG